MDFYEVLEKRRTIRDFPIEKYRTKYWTRFCQPLSKHRQTITYASSSLLWCVDMKTFHASSHLWRKTPKYSADRARSCSRCNGQRRTRYVRQCPAQTATDAYRKRLPRPAVFRQMNAPLCHPVDQSSLNYFASAWAAVENILLAATAEGLACAFRIPIGNEPEYVKQAIHAPEGYEFTCFLAIGYPAENAHICKQKEINIGDRIHHNVW